MKRRRWGFAKIRGAAQALALMAVVAAGVPAALAQERAADALPYVVVLDGARNEVLGAGLGAHRSAGEVARTVLERLAAEGHLDASADSLVVSEEARTLHVRRGPAALLARLDVRGVAALDPAGVVADFRTRPGRPLDPEGLAEDLRALLARYERHGFVYAEARVVAIEPAPEGIAVVIAVSEGARMPLARVQVGPEGRFGSAWAARVAGLPLGRPLRYDPEAVRLAFEDTGLFDVVGVPRVDVIGGEVVLVVPAEAGPPGAFDLVLGYLPPVSPGASGQVVGSGSLALRNPFGQGRSLDLALVRNPGFVSSLDLRVSDPFFLGAPLRLDGRFSGFQQDSTFSRQAFGLEGGFRLAPGLELLGAASRTGVEAGIAGAALVGGVPLVADATTWRAGFGLRFVRLDRPANPRRGLAVFALAEQGAKRRVLPEGDPRPLTLRQQFLTAEVRLFVPTLARQALVLGGDARVVLAEDYDEGDLFRLGGATTLRGYDEDRFRGNVAGRALAEYRYQLDRASYAFAFADLGFVRRPATPGVAASERLAPGYGLGTLVRTPVGLVSVSYALNPDEGPTRGKVHLGLRVGL